MSARPPFAAPIESLLAEFVNTLANAGLKLDPLTEARLRQLDGRRVNIVVRLPGPAEDMAFGLAVSNGTLELVPRAGSVANAVVRGGVADLLGWLTRGANAPGTIEFEGDETVLQELTEIFQHYRPDLSDPLTSIFGSEATANLLNVAEGAMAGLRSATQGAGTAVQRGTARRYVTRTSLDAFLDVLDDARARVDRLNQRVAAVESRSTGAVTQRQAP